MAIRRPADLSNLCALPARQLIAASNTAATENRQKITFSRDIPDCIARRVTVVSDPKQQAEITISSVARNIDRRLKVMPEFTLTQVMSFSLATCPGADHLVRGQLY
jgi:hypothetical protein